MSIIALILILAVAGVCLYVFPGIDPTIRKLIIVICAVVVIVWLLGVFGVLHGGPLLVR